MTAAALSKTFEGGGVAITLVESAQIGTVGVGEATIPNIRYFNQMLGIDEAELMRRTKATIKLGIEFCDWGRIGDRYIHPFGAYGDKIGSADFHQYWIKSKLVGFDSDFDNFCYSIVLARQDRFEEPGDANQEGPLAYSYAFQFDASLYAAFLADFSISRGVVRKEGKVVSVENNPETGFIQSVQLENGEQLSADLFVDCSGFRGLLIEQTLKTGFDDWSKYLPCNRAIAAPCELAGEVGPYTRATAREAGWQWRIPLQHRMGNGLVFCDSYLSSHDATDQLVSHLEGALLADPKELRFTTGKRQKLWNKNCVAIGLSGGFLEPLESTSIDLIQSGIMNLIDLFPTTDCSSVDVEEYNRLMDLEYDRVRDFLMLHYIANQREDSEFWADMRAMDRPTSLSDKIEAFQSRGLVPQYAEGLFQPPSWLAVFIGQNVQAKGYDPRADLLSDDAVRDHLIRIESEFRARADTVRTHAEYLKSLSRDAFYMGRP